MELDFICGHCDGISVCDCDVCAKAMIGGTIVVRSELKNAGNCKSRWIGPGNGYVCSICDGKGRTLPTSLKFYSGDVPEGETFLKLKLDCLNKELELQSLKVAANKAAADEQIQTYEFAMRATEVETKLVEQMIELQRAMAANPYAATPFWQRFFGRRR